MEQKHKFGIKEIVPLIHFALSFIYERAVFIFNDAEAVSFSIPLSDRISKEVEVAVTYGISKLFAFIMIWLLWKVIFVVFEKKIPVRTSVIFGIILVVMEVSVILQWPEGFFWEGDNYITYSYALRFVPEYWHSIFGGCLYAASMMVFPHAIAISLIQCFMFVCTVGYLFDRVDKSPVFEGHRWIKFLTLLFFLFRDTFSIISNPWRTEYNAIFILLFVSVIGMDILEKKKRPAKEIVLLGIYAIFLSVFRTEGIIVAFTGFLILILVVYRPGIKKFIPVVAGMLAVYFLFSLPSKMGSTKYYGSDYSIINTFPTLRNILNSESSNLEYEGAEEDLKDIEALLPLDVIRENAEMGYRYYNYAAGRVDINQSMAGEEVSDAYMSAYYSLVKNNLPIYLRTQMSMLLKALGADIEVYKEEYTGEPTGYDSFGRELWETGIEDSWNIPGFYTWSNSEIHKKGEEICTLIRVNFSEFVTSAGIYTALLILEIVFGLFLIVMAVIGIVRKDYGMLGIGLEILLFAAYFWAIALVMPSAVNSYFHACFYGLFALELMGAAVLLDNVKNKKKSVKAGQDQEETV